MAYTPINTAVYTAAFAGALAGMAVSGWIIDSVKGNYTNVTVIAGTFAQAFDSAWNNIAPLNILELTVITEIVQADFTNRGPGPASNGQLQTVSNWTLSANACVALVLQSDIFFATQGIIPGINPYLLQPIWYVDNVNGSDGNSGLTVNTPLKTTDEIQRRWGSNPLLTIQVSINVSNAPSQIRLNYSSTSLTSGMILRGTSITQLAQGITSTYTNLSYAGNTWCELLSTGVTDWTPYVGKRIRWTSGPVAGYIAWIAKVNPTGNGLASCRITNPIAPNPLPAFNFPPANSPVLGNTFVVEDLGTVCQLLQVTIGTGPTNAVDPFAGLMVPIFELHDLKATKTVAINTIQQQYSVELFGSSLANILISSPHALSVAAWCCILPVAGRIPSMTAYACMVIQDPVQATGAAGLAGNNDSNWFGMLFQGIGIVLDPGQCMSFNNGLGMFDITTTPGNGIFLYDGAFIFTQNEVLGSGNVGYGLKSSGNASMSYSQLPKVTGTLGDVHGGGIDREWGFFPGPFNPAWPNTTGSGGVFPHT